MRGDRGRLCETSERGRDEQKSSLTETLLGARDPNPSVFALHSYEMSPTFHLFQPILMFRLVPGPHDLMPRLARRFHAFALRHLWHVSCANVI
jgi:hypothetical protein